jgi:hypothetical protein
MKDHIEKAIGFAVVLAAFVVGTVERLARRWSR